MAEITVFTDGGARGNPGPSAVGIVIKTGEKTLFELGEYIGEKTNNEAEYTAFSQSVKTLLQHQDEWGISQVIWKLDSLLVVQQLNKKWKVKEPRIQTFVQEIWTQLKQLNVSFQITHIPREKNAAADALVNQALDAQLK